MFTIINNPFRILGLPVNAAEKTIKKNIQNFEVFLSIGQQPKRQETDFEFLGNINRNSETLNEAIRKIEFPKERINYSLFWFSKETEVDKEAFADLIANNIEDAIDKWESTIIGNEIHTNNFTSYKNLGLLYYFKAFQNGTVDLKSLRRSITLYGKSLNSDNFWKLYISHFKNSVLLNAGIQTYTLSYLFRTIFSEIKEKYNIEKDISFIKTLINNKQIPDDLREEIISSLIYEKIKNIEIAIEECNSSCNSYMSRAYNFGNQLHNIIEEEINFIKNIISENDYRFQMLSDKVADEFLRCAITTFKNDLDERYTNAKVETLLNYASEYAFSEIMKKKVQENETAYKEAADSSSNDIIISKFFEKLEESNKRLDKFDNPYSIYIDFLIVLKETLSNLDSTIKDEYRNMILNLSASLFRNCAVNLANNLKDYARAKEILQKSIDYVVDSSIKDKILSDYKIICNNISIENLNTLNNSNNNYSYQSNKYSSSQSDSIYTFNNLKSFMKSGDGKVVFFVSVAILIILLVICSLSENKNNSNNTERKKENTSGVSSNIDKSKGKQDNTSSTNVNNTAKNNVNEETKKNEDADLKNLKVTRLKTGATPYNSYFSSIRSDNSSYCRLTLINETSEDALISLVKKGSDKVVRCVYVRSNEKYTLRNVPQGKYYMKVYKGTAWSNEKTFKSNRIKGGFKYHEDFAKFNTTVDIEQYKTSRGISYSSGDWTLYTITSSSSFDFNSSSSNEFFND